MPIRPHHLNYQMMVLPINLLFSNEDLKKLETPITLISSEKKIIVTKAFLHEEMPNKVIEGQAREGSMRHFKIEIPNQDLVKVSAFLEKGVMALPYVETKITKTVKQGSKYEISF